MDIFSHRHKSYSRVDFFLLSKSIIEQVIDCKTGPIALSDHAPVETQIDRKEGGVDGE